MSLSRLMKKKPITPPPSQPDARLRSLRKQQSARYDREALYLDKIRKNNGGN